MKGYETVPIHIPLNEQEGSVTIDDHGYVVGVSVEITAESDDLEMDYGLSNEAPIVRLHQDDEARKYGGFEVCGVPCCFRGKFRWRFTSNNRPRGLLILTQLKTQPVETGIS